MSNISAGFTISGISTAIKSVLLNWARLNNIPRLTITPGSKERGCWKTPPLWRLWEVNPRALLKKYTEMIFFWCGDNLITIWIIRNLYVYVSTISIWCFQVRFLVSLFMSSCITRHYFDAILRHTLLFSKIYIFIYFNTILDLNLF